MYVKIGNYIQVAEAPHNIESLRISGLERQSGARTRDRRRSKLAALTTAQGPLAPAPRIKN